MYQPITERRLLIPNLPLGRSISVQLIKLHAHLKRCAPIEDCGVIQAGSREDAYVETETREGARKIIDRFNGVEFMGEPLKIQMDRRAGCSSRVGR